MRLAEECNEGASETCEDSACGIVGSCAVVGIARHKEDMPDGDSGKEYCKDTENSAPSGGDVAVRTFQPSCENYESTLSDE